MKIAITGGAGRIGAVLLNALGAEHQISVLDARLPDDPRDGVAYHEVDILEIEGLEVALASVDAVVHLAAIPWDLPDDAPLVGTVNLLGTLNVLEAAARGGVRKVVLASSICAVGPMFRVNPWEPEYFPVDESHPTTPENTYGVSKLINEIQGRMYHLRHGMDVICFRIAPVWFDQMNPFTTWSVAGAYQPEINKDSIWAYVGAEDVAQAIGLAVGPDCDGYRVYNVGAADPCAGVDSLELIQTYYPRVPNVRFAQFTQSPRRPLWSIDKIAAELGYRPTKTWQEYAALLPEQVVEVARTGSSDDLREVVYGTRGERAMG
jgi:UDP-glucose 4-epimerase